MIHRAQPRPPPRRPVELLLETQGAGAGGVGAGGDGVAVPRWILDRMAEMKARKQRASDSAAVFAPIFYTAPRPAPAPLAPQQQPISFSVSYAAAVSSSTAAVAQAAAPPWEEKQEHEGVLHLSALSSSAESVLGPGAGGGGGGGPGLAASRVSAQEFISRGEKEEEDDEGMEAAGLEVLEARLRGWLAQRDMYAAARAEAQLLERRLSEEQPPPSEFGASSSSTFSRAVRQRARLEELRRLLQHEYPLWRAETLPRIRRVHERIRQAKELETSRVSSLAASRNGSGL